jgi:peptide deformylase
MLVIVPVEQIPKTAQYCPVDNLIKLYGTCLEMEMVCHKNQGVGLSAVQVGIPWRLYIVKHDNKCRYFVNCDYSGEGEKIDSVEGCLSLRKEDGSLRFFKVKRFEKVKIAGKELILEKNLSLKDIDFEAEGMEAIVHQHEIEHAGHDGKGPTLISDIGVEYEVWRA